MKILIATAVYYPMTNGVAVFSHNLAKGLAGRGNEVMVVCPSQSGKSYTKTENGVKTVYLKSKQIKMYPDQIHPVPEGRRLPWYKHGLRVSALPRKEIERVIEKFRPDVVHIQVADPIGQATARAARKRGIPIVTTEHNQPEVLTEPLKLPGIIRKPVNKFLYNYFRKWHKKSDFVTMPTEQAIFNLLGEKELGVPIAAVSNGVDLRNFRPGRAKNDAKPTVLYVGRIDPEKKVGLVIEAFLRALKKVPEAEMVVVGDGVARAELVARVKKLGMEEKIRLPGKVLAPELYEIYRNASLFATASEVETQGIVLIEAAATGLPLIAVNKGAVAEVCRDGENGFLCKPGDVAGIAEAMVKILSDSELRERFSKKSLEIAEEHDFERTLDRFLNIYKKVAG